VSSERNASEILTFVAMVVNCTAGMKRKSQRIDVVVTAAEKYLGV
jgi:hypothetical protein